MFINYVKNVANVNKLNINNTNKQKLLFKIMYTSIFNFFDFYILKKKNPVFNSEIMFMIKSNQKQFFLSFIGTTLNYFVTASTGKILSRYKLSTKFFKKSEKANKYLLLFFNNQKINTNLYISKYYLKPINKKNLNFFYLLMNTYKLDPAFIGFKNYYKSIFKRVKRIKKRIKKKLLLKFAY